MLHGQKQVEETAGREMVGHVMRRGNGENGGAEEIAATGTTCGAFRRKVEQALCEIRDGRCPQDGDLLRLLQPGPPASRSKGGGMSAEARLKLRGGEGLTAANVVGIPPPPTAAGGREYPGEEASKGWADLMLRELHPLPQDGLLQVGVRAHAAEDDEEGEVVMAEPVDPSMQQSAERVYVVDPGAVVKTTIRNLGEQALTLTPVFYARKSQCSAGGQGLEEDRQDRVTLKQGEESEMPFVVSVDVDEQATGWRLEDECGRVVLHVCMRVRSATDSSLGCQGVPASMAAPDAKKGDAGLIGSPAGGWQGSTVATAQGFQDRVRAGTCRPLDYDEFKAHAERMTQVQIKNTALSRLWALYQVVHGPGSEEFVLSCKLNTDQTDNNSVLDFHELEVKQPEFNIKIRVLVSESKIWHGLTGNRDLKKPTWVVYELLRQVGVRPTKHCRGPKEQDPDPKDFMYATRYVFCPDTLKRNRHRLQVDGIARGRSGRAADTKPARTSAESSKPVNALVPAAMVAGRKLTAANVVGSPPPPPPQLSRAVLLKPPQVLNSTAAMPNGNGNAGLPPLPQEPGPEIHARDTAATATGAAGSSAGHAFVSDNRQSVFNVPHSSGLQATLSAVAAGAPGPASAGGTAWHTATQMLAANAEPGALLCSGHARREEFGGSAHADHAAVGPLRPSGLQEAGWPLQPLQPAAIAGMDALVSAQETPDGTQTVNVPGSALARAPSPGQQQLTPTQTATNTQRAQVPTAQGQVTGEVVPKDDREMPEQVAGRTERAHSPRVIHEPASPLRPSPQQPPPQQQPILSADPVQIAEQMAALRQASCPDTHAPWIRQAAAEGNSRRRRRSDVDDGDETPEPLRLVDGSFRQSKTQALLRTDAAHSGTGVDGGGAGVQGSRNRDLGHNVSEGSHVESIAEAAQASSRLRADGKDATDARPAPGTHAREAREAAPEGADACRGGASRQELRGDWPGTQHGMDDGSSGRGKTQALVRASSPSGLPETQHGESTTGGASVQHIMAEEQRQEGAGGGARRPRCRGHRTSFWIE